MVHDNPTAATGWLNLAQLNDYGKVMAVCQGSASFTDGSGRHACVVPLWLDDGSPERAAEGIPVLGQGPCPVNPNTYQAGLWFGMGSSYDDHHGRPTAA